MIVGSIKFVLTNVPLITFIAALAAASIARSPTSAPERYLAWLLLLAVGLDGLWAGIFHVFFPDLAAKGIGWTTSPFQYEIGVADAALGAVAIASFWRSRSFKSAIAAYAALFYVGVAVGHVRDAALHGNFSPNNFGGLLIITLLRALMLAALLWAVWREDRRDPVPAGCRGEGKAGTLTG